MNPLTNVKNITKLNEIELASGLIHKKSWHDMYKDSAWIFIGGLEYGLTEGDIITVFSQYGEVVNLNLVRDKKSGKSKGFCFLCYQNQKSTVLAVDNLNGIKLCNRTIRVDHVANYKPPKEDERDDEITKMLKSEGCAPMQMSSYDKTPSANDHSKKKKSKKEKKKKKKKRAHKSDESGSENQISEIKIKREKSDPGYDKYDTSLSKTSNDSQIMKRRKRDYEQSSNETSHHIAKSRPRSEHVIDERSDKLHVSRYTDKQRSKERSEYEYQSKGVYEVTDRDLPSSSRYIKRERSSSSDKSRSYKKTSYSKSERTDLNSKHSTIKRKHTESQYSSSTTSSDEDSSSQSSSEDKSHLSDSKNSRKAKHKNFDIQKSFHEMENKKDHRSVNSYDRKSDKSGHRYETEKYEYKYKYRDDDNSHRDSYHKSKRDKR